jgi:hypothetical protein
MGERDRRDQRSLAVAARHTQYSSTHHAPIAAVRFVDVTDKVLLPLGELKALASTMTARDRQALDKSDDGLSPLLALCGASNRRAMGRTWIPAPCCRRH